MRLTDERVIKMIKKANVSELEYDIETIPDDERDGRTDVLFAWEEADYIVFSYDDTDHPRHEELSNARSLLNETNYGKRIPVDINRGFRPMVGYEPKDIQRAKNIVNQYNRLKRLRDRLWNLYEESKEI